MRKSFLPFLILALILPSASVSAAANAPSTKPKPKASPSAKARTKTVLKKKAPVLATPTQAVTAAPSPMATPAGQGAVPAKGKTRAGVKAGEKTPVIVPAPGPELKALTGLIEVKAAGQDRWVEARSGSIIPQGSTLRSGAGARALLVFSNKSVIWLKEKTTLLVKERHSLMSRLELLAGSIKIKVPHLKRKEKFEIESGGVVCGVRGTVLTMDKPVPVEVKPDVNVLFGEVKVQIPQSLLEPPKGGQGQPGAPPPPDRLRNFTLTQGKGWSNGRMSLLSPAREKDGIQDWTPGIPEEARLAAIREDVARRLAMRQYAKLSASTEDDVAKSRDLLKEEDFATGRTMTDVHGNLVRVDQRFTRPDLNSWEIVNMVKRTNYNFRQRNFAYNGVRGSRLDVMRAKIEFNMRLPQTLNDIPGFVEKIEQLKVDRISVVWGNLRDPNTVFTIGYFGERPSLTETNADDAIDMGLYVGTLTTDPTTSAALKWLALRIEKEGIEAWRINGLSHFLEPPDNPVTVGPIVVDTAPSFEWEGVGGEFYSASAKKWAEVTYDMSVTSPTYHQYVYTGNVMWLCNENYFIDSKGNVWTIKKLLNGDVTLRTFLDDMAIETIAYTKADDGTGKHYSQTDAAFCNPNSDNIDMVYTPDLIVSILKSLFNAAGKVKDDTKTD